MLLLASSSAVILLLATSTVMVVDDTRQRDLVRRTATSQLAPLQADPCRAGGVASRVVLTPRAYLDIDGVIISTATGTVHRAAVEAYWQSASPSPATGMRVQRWHGHRIESAGWCP